jgi:sulfate transport system ATP-binding protein
MSIELRRVSKRFGDVNAVQNVSFTVQEGELLALLGPSGGGKTTVLRMIAGLEVPTQGDIFVRGKRVNDVPVQKRNIGFVFQSYALFKTMNVFKNIAFGLRIKGWRRLDIAARVAELLELLDLRGLERRFPHQLSGASANGWPSPAPWRPSPACCCSTNPSAPSMPKSARIFANGW